MNNKKIIYIFGNPLLDFDNLPLKLAPALGERFPNIDFIIADPNENIKPDEKGELLIIDTVMGLDKVAVFEDIEKIQQDKIYSLHDFDLGFNLKLLQKIGQLKKIKIIGVPAGEVNEEEVLLEVAERIKFFNLLK